jgi:ferredoxin
MPTTNGRGKDAVKRTPAVDRFQCRDCETCLSLCPEVFQRNSHTGFIEVVDLSEYPEEKIQEVISMCPADCIGWEE